MFGREILLIFNRHCARFSGGTDSVLRRCVNLRLMSQLWTKPPTWCSHWPWQKRGFICAILPPSTATKLSKPRLNTFSMAPHHTGQMDQSEPEWFVLKLLLCGITVSNTRESRWSITLVLFCSETHTGTENNLITRTQKLLQTAGVVCIQSWVRSTQE